MQQRRRTPTPSTLEETQKLLASNEDCKKEQVFEQHGNPDTGAGYLTQFGIFSQVGGSRRSLITIFIDRLFCVDKMQI